MTGTKRTLKAREHVGDAAAHGPHARKHRGRGVLLEADTRRDDFLLRREREIFLAKARKEGKDLFGDLEKAAGTPAAKKRVREFRARFEGQDLTGCFSGELRAQIRALADKSARNQREFARLLNELDPKPAPELEADRMPAAEKKRIKAALRAPDVAAGRVEAPRTRIVAIPSEKRGVCYEEMGMYELAGNAFRDAAARVERGDKLLGSRLRERAGNCYARAWHIFKCAPHLPRDLQPAVLMHREAEREYRKAAKLVGKTDPERAFKLERRALDEKAADEACNEPFSGRASSLM